MTHNFKNTQIKKTKNKVSICGTYYGYCSHIKYKTKVCTPCRDARNLYRSNYYKANPEKKRAMDLRYLEKHPGQRKKYDQKYRDNNRDKTRAISLKWNKEHPERMREVSRKRRANKLQNGHMPYTETQVLDLYGTNCHLCQGPIDMEAPRRINKLKGWELALHIDHVVPIIAGGPDTLENVRPSHAICNMKKGAKMTDETTPVVDETVDAPVADAAEDITEDDVIDEDFDFDDEDLDDEEDDAE